MNFETNIVYSKTKLTTTLKNAINFSFTDSVCVSYNGPISARFNEFWPAHTVCKNGVGFQK